MTLEALLEFARAIRLECRTELGRLLLQRLQSGAVSVDLAEEGMRYPLERLRCAEALVAYLESAITAQANLAWTRLPSQCEHESRLMSNPSQCVACGMIVPLEAST